MERKILCWICLLFTVAKCSLEHLQTLAVILFLIFQKYKADKTLQPKGHNIYLPWAARTADDAAFHFCTNQIWMTIKSRQGESYIQTELFSILILFCNLTRIHSQIISQSNWSQHYYSKVISHYKLSVRANLTATFFSLKLPFLFLPESDIPQDIVGGILCDLQGKYAFILWICSLVFVLLAPRSETKWSVFGLETRFIEAIVALRMNGNASFCFLSHKIAERRRESYDYL